MKIRFIMRRDGDKWRLWDRLQGKWRGKGVVNSADLKWPKPKKT